MCNAWEEEERHMRETCTNTVDRQERYLRQTGRTNVPNPNNVTGIISDNISSLCTAKKRFVLCMHIIRFIQFFQLTKNSKSALLLKVSKPRPRVLVRETHRRHSQFLQCEYTTLCPWPPIIHGKITNSLIYEDGQLYCHVFVIHGTMPLITRQCELCAYGLY